MPTQTGYLVLADISGFTAYLANTELDHAHEILSDLLETIVQTFRPMLALAKLEGDAVFAYSPTSSPPAAETLLELLERTYLAFRDKQTSMHRQTTCTCNACRHIPTLDLKFMAHYGAYVVQNVAGLTEIIGSDVNLAHRLLKNHVVEATGWRAYVLFTAAVQQRLTAPVPDWHPQTETYEHLGTLPTWSYDLHPRQQALAAARRVRVTPAQAWVMAEAICAAPPHEVWEWFDDPAKRAQYTFQPGLRFDPVLRPGGRRGPGARNHCVHGKEVAMVETVLDWRPFDYLTVEQVVKPFGSLYSTLVLEPQPDGQHTRVQLLCYNRTTGVGMIDRLIFWLVYQRLFPMAKMPHHLAAAIAAHRAPAA